MNRHPIISLTNVMTSHIILTDSVSVIRVVVVKFPLNNMSRLKSEFQTFNLTLKKLNFLVYDRS